MLWKCVVVWLMWVFGRWLVVCSIDIRNGWRVYYLREELMDDLLIYFLDS